MRDPEASATFVWLWVSPQSLPLDCHLDEGRGWPQGLAHTRKYVKGRVRDKGNSWELGRELYLLRTSKQIDKWTRAVGAR